MVKKIAAWVMAPDPGYDPILDSHNQSLLSGPLGKVILILYFATAIPAVAIFIVATYK